MTRQRHPMGLPARDGSPTVELVQGPTVADGPQAALCRETMCAACYALQWAAHYPEHLGPRPKIDWTQLPAAPQDRRSHAHHEPPRGTACKTLDDGTIPLCRRHHGSKGVLLLAFSSRHSPRFDYDAPGFYRAVMIDDWTAVRDEMQRRAQPHTSNG